MASEHEARIKGRIWQGIAQSGVNLTVLPPEQIDQLVAAITRALSDEVAAPEATEAATQTAMPQSLAPAASPDEEQILWEGSPLLSMGVKYQITSQRVRIFEGVLNKVREDIELVRIQDVDHSQSISERMTNVGDIHIRSHDSTNPSVTLSNVTDPQGVHEILRRAVLEARRRYGVSYREQM